MFFEQNWKCPVAGCKYEFKAYGEESFRTLKELHLDAHAKEEKKAAAQASINFLKNKAEFEARLFNEAKSSETLATVHIPKKDYNKLELTVADKAFLKTRGIKVED
jgi:hypothetical protein